MNVCVYGAASSLINESYKNAGKELGRKMVEKGMGLVFGGGANGMMGALAEGVHEKNGYILGVVPEFFQILFPLLLQIFYIHLFALLIYLDYLD